MVYYITSWIWSHTRIKSCSGGVERRSRNAELSGLGGTERPWRRGGRRVEEGGASALCVVLAGGVWWGPGGRAEERGRGGARAGLAERGGCRGTRWAGTPHRAEPPDRTWPAVTYWKKKKTRFTSLTTINKESDTRGVMEHSHCYHPNSTLIIFL